MGVVVVALRNDLEDDGDEVDGMMMTMVGMRMRVLLLIMTTISGDNIDYKS